VAFELVFSLTILAPIMQYTSLHSRGDRWISGGEVLGTCAGSCRSAVRNCYGAQIGTSLPCFRDPLIVARDDQRSLSNGNLSAKAAIQALSQICQLGTAKRTLGLVPENGKAKLWSDPACWNNVNIIDSAIIKQYK
jgi:hypothetical protein